MTMSVLRLFPPPPPDEAVTVCEQNAVLIAICQTEKAHVENEKFSDLNIACDSLRPFLSKENVKTAFIEREGQRGWLHLKHIWKEHRLQGVLQELSENNFETLLVIRATATVLLKAFYCQQFLIETLSPSLKPVLEEISEFSPHTSWGDGYSKAIAWHPSTHKLAIALRDDSIKVFTRNRPEFVPVLKHKDQHHVTCLAWRPNNSSMLAVGCQYGVIIWSIEPGSLATRPSSGATSLWAVKGHSPVTSLSWDPKGHLLCSVSPSSRTIMLWSLDDGATHAVHRWGGAGFTGVAWSPDGGRLLAFCPTNEFRVFECFRWQSERWCKLQSRVQTACWGPDSRTVLFSCKNSSVIYVIQLKSKHDILNMNRPAQNVAIALTNVAKIDVDLDGHHILIGGVIRHMVWDPTGERLAVQFTSSDCIAVFHTQLTPSVDLLPGGYIKGHLGESPELMTFSPSFENGALLTVVWNSGRVAHIPMHFTPRSKLKTLQCPLGGHSAPIQNLYSLD